MTKHTVMGVHAPPPRLTRAVKGLASAALIALIIVLGLALDPVIRTIIGLG